MAKKEKKPEVDLVGCSPQTIVDKLNTKYGVNTLAIASKAVGLRIEFISTGIYKLDAALGGGVPKNRITEIRGDYSSGKTTIILSTIANFQRMHKKGLAFFIDVEKTFDPAYAKLLGCDLGRIIIVNSDSGEQAIDVLNDVLNTGVDVFIAVDSIAALVPTAEIEASMDQQFQGLQPRLINRMMRVANAKLKRSLYDLRAPSTTVFAANQLREKIGVMYGNPETTPGGKGKDFTYSIRIKVLSSPGDKLINTVKVAGVERKVQYGQVIRFNISKNKCGGNQHEEGEFEYYKKPFKHYPPFSFNNDDFLFDYGRFFELVKEKNGKFVFKKVSAGKEYLFIEKLSQDEDARIELFEEIMERLIKENAGEGTETEFEEEDSEDVEVVSKKKLSFRKK